MDTRLTPLNDADWNRATARHLLQRAGFGIPHSAVDALHRAGPAGAVDLMVNYEQFPALPPPDFLTSHEAAREALMEAGSAPSPQQARNLVRRLGREELARLKAWWLDRMVQTKRPLEEKLALFWHGHFATSAAEVRLPLKNFELNQIFRRNASGSFSAMLLQVAQSPAMLEYLDNRRNLKDRPNENWARELLELFTLGIGHYSEQDIKEAARAFTGYTERNGEYRFNERQHDPGEKTFLGQTGRFDGEHVLRIITQQPQCARFIARKLWVYFAYNDPDDALVEALASTLRESKYQLKPLLAQIFHSREFYTPRAMEGQVKSPVQFLVMLRSHLALTKDVPLLTTMALRAMGQDLFEPPNVSGWPHDREWIDSNTLLMRYNTAGFLLTGERMRVFPTERLDDMGGGQQDQAEQDARAVRTANRGAVREQIRRDIARRAVQRQAGLDIRKLLEPLEGMAMGAAVDRVADYLLGRPLDAMQRHTLLASIGGNEDENAPFRAETIGEAKMCGLLHLLCSMAEYQLC